MGIESLIMQEEIDRKELLDDTQKIRTFYRDMKETEIQNLSELFDNIQLRFIQDNPELDFNFITFLKTYSDYAKSYIRKD
ncbi:hypothetical protein [Clostridium sp. 1001283B150210_160208_E6]|jgi:hypothetical protein|uniref:Uncharacterized protein n=1 Tax=Siphoviridae sp. cteLh2 TaxID=2825590 RepID=A0A8S5U5U0_9CAUD|nr:hypothetical protein [Clostridium sp. 1001283B150210_160208_E6]DAF89840.1 MAG TPA: hypothetical protein [Siphoviridae sp. cteLh2]